MPKFKTKTWPVQKIVGMVREGLQIKEIAKIYGVERGTVSEFLSRFGLNKESVKFNHNFFNNIDNESTAYWFGFMMADGCVYHDNRVCITLQESDYQHLENWHKAIDSCLKIRKSFQRFKGKYYPIATTTHCSKIMYNDLVNLGCVPRKSLKLKFPELPEHLLNHFVRGYFDGDGCASIHAKNKLTPQLSIKILGTYQFLMSLQKIFGTNNKLYKHGNIYVFGVAGNKKAGKIAKWMYHNANIYLSRKREVCNAILQFIV